MLDRQGRNIEYLRLSITERCNLRCAYCRAGEGACPKQTELSCGNLLRIVRVLAELGIHKVRLTGGEPMLRKDLPEIAAGIAACPGITEIAMTTNAQQLPGKAKLLKEAGISRLNISIDSLRPERYEKMTGGGSLEAVLSGVKEAVDAGLTPVKLNAVLLRGVNDDEVDDFIALTRDLPIDMRFIELMPMGSEDLSAKRVPSDELLAARPHLALLPPRYPGQPSIDYQAPGHKGRVGFISPMSHKFCGDCNRVRVMSDGLLRPCLGNNAEISLLPALSAEGDGELRRVMEEAIWNKPHTHAFDGDFQPDRNMSRIGG